MILQALEKILDGRIVADHTAAADNTPHHYSSAHSQGSSPHSRHHAKHQPGPSGLCSRVQVWKPALKQAGLTFNVRTHDLRHAHASWLLAGGADPQTVEDRLGHGSITTTDKYLHTLPEADDVVVDAFSRIRNLATAPGSRSRRRLA